MIKKILNTQTQSIGRASFLLAVFYVISALMGLWRDHLLAGRIGTEKLDMYYAAFTIPDLLGMLMIFGAISAAIIPMFTSYLKTSEKEAWEYVDSLLNVFLVALIVVCGIFITFSPWITRLITPGFSPEKQAVTASLMRLLFLSPIILGVSNIISGILQVFHRFLVTALAPLVYNTGIIIGIIFLVPRFGLIGLVLGVLLGALLHLLIQLPIFFYVGFSYKPIFNFGHAGVKKTLALMIPRSLGLGAGQINTIATTTIASTLLAGSIGIFTLANNLSNMAVSMLGVSISTAMFPSLSKKYLDEDKTPFNQQFSEMFLRLVLFTIPVSVGLFFLRAQVVRVVLGSGSFSWLDTRLAAACLGIFAIGICFQGLIVFLSKTFYAAHNTKLPAIASVATVALNIVLSLWFVSLLNARGFFYGAVQAWLKLQGIEHLGVLGLALAFSVAGLVEALALLYYLQKHYHVLKVALITRAILKMLLAGLVMAGIIYASRQLLVSFNIIQTQTTFEVAFQLIVSGLLGALGYATTLYFLKSKEFFGLAKFLS